MPARCQALPALKSSRLRATTGDRGDARGVRGPGFPRSCRLSIQGRVFAVRGFTSSRSDRAMPGCRRQAAAPNRRARLLESVSQPRRMPRSFSSRTRSLTTSSKLTSTRMALGNMPVEQLVSMPARQVRDATLGAVAHAQAEPVLNGRGIGRIGVTPSSLAAEACCPIHAAECPKCANARSVVATD